MIKREVKLETMLNTLIERGGYSRNRQAILDSIKVTAAALSQYTRGRTRPSFDKLVALADFFGVSLDYLVYGEPASTPVDPGPIARYVQRALMDVSTRTDRHSELVARIGRLLMDRIDDVAKEVVSSRSAGMEGLIELNETLRVERHCRQANIVSTDLEPNLSRLEDDGDEAMPGQFFPIVVENLQRGSTYQFLLAGELTTQSPTVTLFREMINDAVGGDTLHERCFFRTATRPVASTTVLYDLDTSTFSTSEPALFAQFGKYLFNGTWLGYVNRPNHDSTADMLMTPNYVDRASKAFGSLWSEATL